MAFLVLARAVDFYTLLVFVWALGGWVPQWRWQDWYRTLGRFVEPYVGLFRSLGLAAGGLDFSAMVAAMALQLVSRALVALAVGRMP